MIKLDIPIQYAFPQTAIGLPLEDKSHIQIILTSFSRTKAFSGYGGHYQITEEDFGLKVFDNQKMINKYLFCEINYRNDIQNFYSDLQLILGSMVNKLDLKEQTIEEIQKLKQIWLHWDILIYDAYIIKDEYNYFLIKELEDLELPLYIFLNYMHQDNIHLICKIKRKIEYYLKLRYKKSDLNISLKNYFVQINEKDEIKVKTIININQYIIYDSPKIVDDTIFDEHHFQINPGQLERIQQISDQKIKESLRKQFEIIKEKIKIKKQNLTIAIGELAPDIMNEDYHCKEIFQILEQHPKYNLYSLIDYDKDYFILKIYDSKRKYLIKLEKFDSSNDAQSQKQKYELLRNRQQENEGVFLDIGDCEVICAEKWWYVLLEEHFSVNQQSCKLIPLQQIDRIQQYFSKMDCSQYYIQMHLIIRNLKQYELIQKLGFSINELSNCIPYICISGLDKISQNKIFFSNPYFLSQKKQFYSIRQEKQFIDICQSLYYDESIYSCFANFKDTLIQYLKDQDFLNSQIIKLDDIHIKQPKLSYMINQIEYIITFSEQFQFLLNKDYYINDEFDIILSFNIDKFAEKSVLYNQITKLQFQQFECTSKDLQIYLKYLTNDNNIHKLLIKRNKNEEEIKISGESYDINELKNERLNNFDQIFQHLKELQIEYHNKISIHFKSNYLQNLKFLKNIKINFIKKNYYEYFDPLEMKKMFEIFDENKNFEQIDVNFDCFIKRQFICETKVVINHFQKQEQQPNMNASNIYEKFVIFCQNDRSQIYQLSCKKQEFNYEYTIIDNEQHDCILYLKFFTNNQLNQEKIELYLKLRSDFIYSPCFKIEQFKCQHQQRMNCQSDLTCFYINKFLSKCIQAEQEAEYFKQVLGSIPSCQCDDINQLALKIYKDQTQLKSMKLHINGEAECSKLSLRKVCDQLCLTQGNSFLCLQEIIFQFYGGLQNNDDLNKEIYKEIMKIMSKNRSVNTLIFSGNKIPKSMFKLKRIVRFKRIYHQKYDDDYFFYLNDQQ